MQDADESVGELPQGRAVTETAVALFVVVGAGTGGGLQCRECLCAQGIDEPIAPGRIVP